ncbi:MAG: hypothetical protein ACHRHE_01705 [Tepidisphaerales bacterium]
MQMKRPNLDVPWITEKGFFDPAQFPIDAVLKQALSDDPQEFRSAVGLLRSMSDHGRNEAGIFLLGLLISRGDDWEDREVIVRALLDVKTQSCADLLFGELTRVKSTNTTRRYLRAVIDTLSAMPPALVRSGFENLAENKSFTHRMRTIFKNVLDQMDYGELRGY